MTSSSYIYFCLVSLMFLSFSVKLNSGANILVVYPMETRSIFQYFDTIVYKLASRGHNITAFAPFLFTKHENIIQVVTDVVFYSSQYDNTVTVPNYIVMSITCKCIAGMSKHLFENKEFQKLMLSNSTFDLVITNDLPYNMALSILAYRYQCPSVSILNHGSASHVSWLLGEPLNLAYSPEVKSAYSDHMTFLETLHNIYLTFISLFILYWEMIPYNEQMLDSFANSLPFLKDRIPLTEIIQNKSLLIIPTDHHIDYNYARSDRLKFIAGITIQEINTLPDNYEDFMANAADGVILISWGTVINGSNANKCEEILWSAFKHLKQKVIWKTSNNKLLALNASNIMTSKWVPQNDLLAHKNLKLYFTHGGIRSLSEATFHGIPMIVTPFYLDQFKNAERIRQSGAGLVLNYGDYTVESVLEAVKEVIYNPKYKREAVKRSASMKDRIIAPPDEAIYWIEYVLKHGNVLQSAASSLPFYKLYLLDVFSFFLILLLIIYILLRLICKSSKAALYKCFVQTKNNSNFLKTKKLK